MVEEKIYVNKRPLLTSLEDTDEDYTSTLLIADFGSS
jgi:hypothetical protein